jgi:Uma2 family endonuclease
VNPMRQFTVEEYHQMIEAAILTENDPVELIEGWIVTKFPCSPAHDGTVELIHERLSGVLPVGWRVRIKCGVTLADSEPEPDAAIVRGEAQAYVARHPGPADIALIAEVAESSLTFDRGAKCRAYARAGIISYCIVNLVDRQIEVYTEPTGPVATPSYRQRIDYGPTDSVPLTISGQQVALIPVTNLLP